MNRIKRRLKKRQGKPESTQQNTQPESTPESYPLPRMLNECRPELDTMFVDMPGMPLLTTEELDELLKGSPTTEEVLASLPTTEEVLASLPPFNFDNLPTITEEELERIRLDAVKALEQAKEQIDKLFLN